MKTACGKGGLGRIKLCLTSNVMYVCYLCEYVIYVNIVGVAEVDICHAIEVSFICSFI